MAANSNLSLTSLDFDTLKANFITYLQSQSQFKDFNFSGSNINVLLDILSYNSYLNSFYLNMVVSEMFLDSAQLLNSVVSHSKELNYLPRSATSSTANVEFMLDASGISNPLIIPAGTTFAGVNSNDSYIFTTSENSYYTSANTSNGVTTYVINNLLIYEGQYLTDSYIVDYTQQNQQFVMSNPNIDINSLVITVYENTGNSSSAGVIYNRVDTLFNLNSNSTIYFVQAAQDGKYEILFGDNLMGHIPLNNSLITAKYRVASGDSADGISSFTMTYNLGSYNGGIVALSGTINCVSNSSGGANQEIISSIKFNAPRYFATQQRAVASDDYSALILSNFGGNIADVSVYGGELLTPKQYGTTAVCLKPTDATVTPDYIKTQITNFLLNYISLPNKVVITDPDYFYCAISSNVSFDATTTSLSSSDIKNEVLNSILAYNNTNLQVFNGNLRYSRLGAYIDNSDDSIISNDTTIILIKRITPVVNTNISYIINYNNEASLEDFNYQLTPLPPSSDEPSFYSSPFTYISNNGVQYPNSILRDDNYGNLVIFNTINSTITEIISNVGTINYQTGQVQINNLNVAAYVGNYISLYFFLQNTDIMSSKNQILMIDPNDVSINILKA